MTDKITPFTFVNSISSSSRPLEINDDNRKHYVPFVINRALSYRRDAVRVANEINRFSDLDVDMQYRFLKGVVPNSRQFSKWGKKQQDKQDAIDAIARLYKCSKREAAQYLSVLDRQSVDAIVERASLGGTKSTK